MKKKQKIWIPDTEGGTQKKVVLEFRGNKIIPIIFIFCPVNIE